jgi:methylisocitrate lyase
MLFQSTDPKEKRKHFRSQLKTSKLLKFPGAYSPLVAMAIERKKYDGIYVSGAVLSNDLGYPDIGLTTLTEVSQRGRQIARATALPTIIDIDTGFGETMSVARTIQEMTEMGLAGCHLEDQINPKRCGHLDGKGLVDSTEMIKKIKAAEKGKTDSNFLIIARTDSRASEGLEKSIARAKSYVDAGAEMIFPEALQDEKEFEAFRKAISVPLLANMTEFGKSKLLNAQQLENLGYNVVIYPVTMMRIAMKAVENALDQILVEGSQEKLVPEMQTRKELYELLQYERYNEFDQNVFNFTIK